MKDIYTECINAGIEVDNHESDLYIPVNAVTTAIIKQYKFASNVTQFFNQVTKNYWYDVPFAFTPFWEKKAKHGNPKGTMYNK